MQVIRINSKFILWFYTLLFQLCSSYSISQKWFTGSWVWEVTEPYSAYKTWATMGNDGTVTINGIQCTRLKLSGRYQNYSLYVYEENDKVYISHSSEFKMLYDFNKKKGDSWVVYEDTCKIVIKVDSTSLDTINGNILPVMYLSSERGGYGGKIIKYIGNTSSPLLYFPPRCYGNIQTDDSYFTGLRCYSSTFLGFVDFKIAPNCYHRDLSTNSKNLHLPNLLQPNPASDIIEIELPYELSTPVNLSIKDMQGNLVFTKLLDEKLFNQSIDVHALPGGVYVYIISNNASVLYAGKLIKI